MYNNDWERMGNDIFRTVQDAVESCNYDRLNQTISDTVNQVVDGVSQGMRAARGAAQQAAQNRAGYRRTPEAFERRIPSRAGARALFVLGIIWTAIFGFAEVVFLLGILLGVEGISILPVGVVGCFLIAAIVAIKAGLSKLRLIKRFKTYIKTIGYAEFCNISELAISVRKDQAFVIKDLEKIMQKNWLPQGHFDKQKTCLMVTNQMYREYLLLEERKEQLQKEEALKKKEEEQIWQQRQKTLSPEVQKVIEQGDAFVKKIRECNDAIPGEEVSAKIDKMEKLVDRIFDRVEEHPSSISDIRKLMDYYLPTTVKLLEAYAQMDAQPTGGENIETAKREIEATLDTLNAAFEKILDSLFQETAWDVSSDISVLNTMMAQDGLKEDGLKK